MKVDHRYTMFKSNGFELMLKLPSTPSGRQLASQVVATKSVGRRTTKKLNNLMSKGPLSRALEKQVPKVKVSRYVQYQMNLEYNKKTAERKQVADSNSNNESGMATALTVKNAAKKSPSDVMIILPKNGNNKKKIKLKRKKNKSLTITCGNETSVVNLPPVKHCLHTSLMQHLDNLARNPEDPFCNLKYMRCLLEHLKTEDNPPHFFDEAAAATINSMQEHPTMASIQDFACQIFSWLLGFGVKNSRRLIGVEHNGIEAILTCMETHKGNLGIQTKATMVLRKILLHPTDYTESPLELPDTDLAKRIMQVVHTAMLDHKEDPTIQANACFIFYALPKAGAKVDQTALDNLFREEGGGFQSTITAFEKHTTSIMVQMGALVAGLELRGRNWMDDEPVEIVVERMLVPVVRMLLSVVTEHTLTTCINVASLIILNCGVFNLDEFVDAIETDPTGATVFLNNSMGKRTFTSDVNKTAYLRTRLHYVLVALINVCTVDAIQEYYERITDYVVHGMQLYAGKTGVKSLVESSGCTVLDALINRCPREAKQYILRGENSNNSAEDSSSSKCYGAADDVLFALVQREIASASNDKDEIFQRAGKLMFKLRDPTP